MVVMVRCVPKSMLIGPGEEKPTPWRVTISPTLPDDGLRRVILEVSLN